MGKMTRVLLPLIGAVLCVGALSASLVAAYSHSQKVIVALYIVLLVAVPLDWLSFGIHVRAYAKTGEVALSNRIIWTFLIAAGSTSIAVIVLNILTGRWLPALAPSIFLVAGVLFPSAASVIFVIKYLRGPQA